MIVSNFDYFLFNQLIVMEEKAMGPLFSCWSNIIMVKKKERKTEMAWFSCWSKNNNEGDKDALVWFIIGLIMV